MLQASRHLCLPKHTILICSDIARLPLNAEAREIIREQARLHRLNRSINKAGVDDKAFERMHSDYQAQHRAYRDRCTAIVERIVGNRLDKTGSLDDLATLTVIDLDRGDHDGVSRHAITLASCAPQASRLAGARGVWRRRGRYRLVPPQ